MYECKYHIDEDHFPKGRVEIYDGSTRIARCGFEVRRRQIEIGPAEASMVVHEDYRGDGIGKKLAQMAVLYAQTITEFDSAIARIAPYNGSARKMFESLGFALTEQDYMDESLLLTHPLPLAPDTNLQKLELSLN
jgi:GNAT superfamily N-acetyltransferase